MEYWWKRENKMPRYVYRCKECEKIFEKVHSMSEKLKDCETCKTKESLIRVPNLITKKIDQKGKVGDIVKQFIDDAKSEVAQEKKKMKEEEYKS